MEIKYHQHIGIYKDVVPHQLCDKFISIFNNTKLKLKRKDLKELKPGDRPRDKYVFLEVLMSRNDCSTKEKQQIENVSNTFYKIFSKALEDYAYKYPHIDSYGKLIPFGGIKVQKTLPGEGYHVFHCEQNFDNLEYASRALVWTLYLNDVKEGGETEYLNQLIRIKPKKGTLCIWPAGLTHPHRGNTPFLQEKYIATGWLCSEQILNLGNKLHKG